MNRRDQLTLLAVAALRKRRRIGYHSSGLRARMLLLTFTLAAGCKRKERREMAEKECKRRRWWVQPIFADHDIVGAWASLIPTLRATNLDFYYNFMRMTPEAFDSLLVKVEPFLRKKSWRKPICPGERLAITLRYLASGESQVDLSYIFRVSSEAISQIVRETTAVIWNVLKDEVFEEQTEEMWIKVAAEFEEMWNFPHCLGAIDGRHNHVRNFPHAGSRYYNYKGRFSISSMAVADAKYRFIAIESGASGKRGDSGIFCKSVLGRKLEDNSMEVPPPCHHEGFDTDIPFVFVADAAYACSDKILTPFKGANLNPPERVYNYRLSRARRCVENAFGIVCARYIIMQREIKGSLSLAKSVILCCYALHNLHMKDEESVPPKRRRYCPVGYADYVRNDGKYIFGRWRNENPQREKQTSAKIKAMVDQARGRLGKKFDGKSLREKYVQYVIDYPLKWQWKAIGLM